MVWHDKGLDTNNIQVGIIYPTDGEIRLMLLVQISVAIVDRVQSAESLLAWSKVVGCWVISCYKYMLFHVSFLTVFLSFFDIQVVVLCEFVPHKLQTNITALTPYSICEKVCWNWHAKWNSRDWSLHHDSVLTCSDSSVHGFLPESNITIIPHPHYSPDLAQCDFFFSQKLKMVLKGRRFNNVAKIQARLWDVLAEFQTSDFRKCFEQWCDCWAYCR